MAIEDGVCLADCIAAANGEYEAAFRRYENARVARTARVTLESRYIWDVYHSDGTIAKCTGRCLANAAKRTLSDALLGFTTDLHCQSQIADRPTSEMGQNRK